MTRLLIVSEQVWPQGSGGTLATHLAIKLFAQRNIDTTVITGTPNPAKIEGVRYILPTFLKFSEKLRLWAHLVRPSVQHWFKSMFRETDVVYIPRYCYPLIPLARDLCEKVVVHLHDYQLISYNAAIFHNSQRRSFLDSLNDELLFELSEHTSLSRALLGSLLIPLNRLSRTFVAEADKILCVSKRQSEIIGRGFPEIVEKVSVIYNPLPELSIAEKRLEGPTMMYVGGDSYLKGFHIFLRASCELLKQNPHIKFMLTRPYKDTNALLIDRLNQKFGGAYNLTGYLKYEELRDLHSRSWALLFPSIWEEPFGYAVLEAMLAGTVPIASSVGGVPEIVRGTFAEKMLFDPGSVDSFVDRIESLVAMSEEQLTDLGFGLRETALKRFGSEATKEKLLNAFLS